MPRKVKKLDTPRARRSRRKVAVVATGGASSNPPLLTDIVQFAAPGFAGYAGTRFLQRILYTQLSKRWPKASRHLTVASGAAAFLAAWFLLHRIKRLEKYHTPATVGSFIAAAQTIVQTYLPKFGWMVSDFQPTVGSTTAPAVTAREPMALPPIDDEVEDDDVVDPLADSLGSLAGSTIGRAPAAAFRQNTPSAAPPLDDGLGDDDLDDGDDLFN